MQVSHKSAGYGYICREVGVLSLKWGLQRSKSWWEKRQGKTLVWNRNASKFDMHYVINFALFTCTRRFGSGESAWSGWLRPVPIHPQEIEHIENILTLLGNLRSATDTRQADKNVTILTIHPAICAEIQIMVRIYGKIKKTRTIWETHWSKTSKNVSVWLMRNSRDRDVYIL